MEILAETGTDLSKWETEKHFVSWLNLCPNNKISGGKLISSQIIRKKPNPDSQAFRSATNAVQKGNYWLGDYFRRMKSKGSNKYAIVATANKIATIYYKMVRYKNEFNPVDLEHYQQNYKQAKIAFYEKKLLDLKKHVALVNNENNYHYDTIKTFLIYKNSSYLDKSNLSGRILQGEANCLPPPRRSYM